MFNTVRAYHSFVVSRYIEESFKSYHQSRPYPQSQYLHGKCFTCNFYFNSPCAVLTLGMEEQSGVRSFYLRWGFILTHMNLHIPLAGAALSIFTLYLPLALPTTAYSGVDARTCCLMKTPVSTIGWLSGSPPCPAHSANRQLISACTQCVSAAHRRARPPLVSRTLCEHFNGRIRQDEGQFTSCVSSL
jgi:hypothetical protein